MSKTSKSKAMLGILNSENRMPSISQSRKKQNGKKAQEVF